jgi:hypothetical protein
MLTLYKRHNKVCAETRIDNGVKESVPELRSDRGYRRCSCPIHAEGTLRIDGFVRRATGEVKWPEAEKLKKKWEDAGTLDVAPAELAGPAPQVPPTVAHVIEQFIMDRTACKLSSGTLKKYRQFTDMLTEYCSDKGVVYITQFGTDYTQVNRSA